MGQPAQQGLAAQDAQLLSRSFLERPSVKTAYQVFVGPGTPFERKRISLVENFANGPGNTLLVVEANDPVPWAQPEDLVYDPDKPIPPLRQHATRSGG